MLSKSRRLLNVYVHSDVFSKEVIFKNTRFFLSTLYLSDSNLTILLQAGDRREMAVGVMQRLDDLNTVLGQTNDHRGNLASILNGQWTVESVE